VNGAATWEGTGVSLDEIEKHLHRLWRAADSLWDGDGRRPDIRTSVLNLIVYARDMDCCGRAKQAIEHLSGTHPSRSLILIPGEPSGELSIDAQCSIISHGAYAEYRQVCSEQLILRIHGQASRHLASIIYPLLAPDLPVFIWWPGETPFHHQSYGQLRSLADRFIVDSSDFDRPAQDLVAMAHSMLAAGAECAFSDFNWARLAPWREMVAAFFDDRRFLPYLSRLKTISIDAVAARDNTGHDLPQALLLSAWLASSLGLRTNERKISERRYVLDLANGTRGPKVDIKVARASSEAAAVVRLEADGSGDEPPAEFTVALDRKSRHISATAILAGQAPMMRKTAVVELDESQLLFKELEIFGHDEAFEKALACAANMIDPRYHRELVKGSLLV
jgi:glucose-6-phosphate dehydrogenase assembly protein OpcA